MIGLSTEIPEGLIRLLKTVKTHSELGWLPIAFYLGSRTRVLGKATGESSSQLELWGWVQGNYFTYDFFLLSSSKSKHIHSLVLTDILLPCLITLPSRNTKLCMLFDVPTSLFPPCLCGFLWLAYPLPYVFEKLLLSL